MIEKRKIHLETIEKGQHHPGNRLVWKGNIVESQPQPLAFYERRHRIIANEPWNAKRKAGVSRAFFGIWIDRPLYVSTNEPGPNGLVRNTYSESPRVTQ